MRPLEVERVCERRYNTSTGYSISMTYNHREASYSISKDLDGTIVLRDLRKVMWKCDSRHSSKSALNGINKASKKLMT